MFNVGYMQFEPVFGDIEANLNLVSKALQEVESDLIVLPELAFTGYAFNGRDEAFSLSQSPRGSEIESMLESVCRKKDMHIVTGFAEREGDKCFNSSLLIGSNGLKTVYRKVHLFNTEKDCFDPGGGPFEVSSVGGVGVGMMICFDWIFPEAARSLALKGADIICHPSNLVIPVKCQYAMVTRCVENRVFAVTANRYGSERGVDFTGASQIVDPSGSIVHLAPERGDELFSCDVDVEMSRDKWITPKNNILQDRCPDTYNC